MNIAKRIDELLKVRNMSRRQAALKAGIPPSSFQSAMQRNGSMTIEMLEKITAVLGCSISDIIGSDGEIVISIDINDDDRKKRTGLKSNPEYFSAFMEDGLSECAETSIHKRYENSASQRKINEMVSLFKVAFLAAKGIYPETTEVFAGIDISPNTIQFVQKLIELSPEAREAVLHELASAGSAALTRIQGESDVKKDDS